MANTLLGRILILGFCVRFFTQKWAFLPCALTLCVASIFYFGLTGTYWALTGEFTRWSAHILSLLGVDTTHLGYFKIIGLSGSVLERVDGMMVLGMLAGAFCAALWRGGVRLSYAPQWVRALLGGVLAGFGARLGMGCNLASFMTGIPQFSLHAWFFTVASLAGIYLGLKIVRPLSCPRPLGVVLPSKIGAILGLGVFVGVIALAWRAPLATLAWAVGFGWFFGFVIARSQFCFTCAFRDLFVWGKIGPACALVVGMMIASIGVFGYIQLGVPAKIMWASPGILIGGLLFGLGIVLAGGCECGWLFRAMEGQIHFMLVGVGNIIGAGLLALSWDHYSSWITGYPKINLLLSLGHLGGLLCQYALLLLLLLFVLGVGRIASKG
ncbi:YeeE/YedE thiosulfate transporter family protein [Helicobacter bizzozeronii]|uniref:YeeE/YedE thiosulfate transporter family protein n=1 Tax=Helicobacter bizzozeronii TaxID=56877 RepID=UPI0018F860D0|nr:YeeE/YedE thiosulfate transporter family protein [Helicobacter bizzozeronii]